MESNFKWPDGQPVTSEDVEFWLDGSGALDPSPIRGLAAVPRSASW
jgi:ABC-type transport system substrate-binding protein